MAEELELRKTYVDLFKQYLGCQTNDDRQMFLVDVYNLHVPLPRNTRMQYGWAWCACATSAVAYMAQLDDIIPFEMGCYEMMKIAQSMGIWHNAPFTPQPGDLIMYDWDNKHDGVPDHVGVVEVVGANYVTVIEGNANGGKCARRTIALSDHQILGYIAPDYASKATGAETPEKPPEKPQNAEGYDPTIRGDYTVKTALYLRQGAGVLRPVITTLPQGATVTCNGYYATSLGKRWYYVAWQNYVGYCSSTYLTRQ